MVKCIIIIILIAEGLFFWSYVSSLKANEGKVFSIDEYSYFIYKNHRYTFEGVIDTIIQERKDKFIEELFKGRK